MRYLIIAMLLIPAWVGAGELENVRDLPNGCQVMDRMKVCDGYDLNVIQYVMTNEEHQCYQRMREAMVLLDRWLSDAEADNVSIHGGVYPNVKRHWRAVMNDCVEGQ